MIFGVEHNSQPSFVIGEWVDLLSIPDVYVQSVLDRSGQLNVLSQRGTKLVRRNFQQNSKIKDDLPI
jgi:hypothetical protein